MSPFHKPNAFRAIAELMARTLFDEFDWMRDPELSELYFITQGKQSDKKTDLVLARYNDWDEDKVEDLKRMRRQYNFAISKGFLPEKKD